MLDYVYFLAKKNHVYILLPYPFRAVPQSYWEAVSQSIVLSLAQRKLSSILIIDCLLIICINISTFKIWPELNFFSPYCYHCTQATIISYLRYCNSPYQVSVLPYLSTTFYSQYSSQSEPLKSEGGPCNASAPTLQCPKPLQGQLSSASYISLACSLFHLFFCSLFFFFFKIFFFDVDHF